MPIEQPKITQRGEETIASHPAFGQIGASRQLQMTREYKFEVENDAANDGVIFTASSNFNSRQGENS